MKSLLYTTVFLGVAVAFSSVKDLQAEVKKRQFEGSTELIGDLATLPDIALSSTAKQVKAILLGIGPSTDLSSQYTTQPPALGSGACFSDRCCVWKHISDAMREKMYDSSKGMCTDFARGAIRMGFHDAAAWDKFQQMGGADGSILLTDEISRSENAALIPTAAIMKGMWEQYKNYSITMADFIQTAAKVAAVSCPGGPRVRMFIGRVDDPHPNTDGLLPSHFSDAPELIDLFANKTVSAGGLIALIGAHTASRQKKVDPALAGQPQDTTPGTWDTKYFTETLASQTPPGVFRFHSDVSLANDPTTGPVFKQFAAQKSAWDKAYAAEYIRMSLMGVQEINGMVECTKALPMPV